MQVLHGFPSLSRMIPGGNGAFGFPFLFPFCGPSVASAWKGRSSDIMVS